MASHRFEWMSAGTGGAPFVGGEDGRYALSMPGPGSYVLTAAVGGHQPQAVSVTVGERPVEPDVVLGGAGRLAGTVLTADGTPVREATVTLADVHGEVAVGTRSGREGGHVITELVAGEYTVIASGYPPVATVLQVAGGGRAERDLHLGHEDRQPLSNSGPVVIAPVQRGGAGARAGVRRSG